MGTQHQSIFPTVGALQKAEMGKVPRFWKAGIAIIAITASTIISKMPKSHLYYTKTSPFFYTFPLNICGHL